nr:phage integrase N-terminal SAM-like domain-containing protein [Lachnospiraceae bacterium]
MKEELMEEVMQHMLSCLDNAQMKQLRQVMEHALCRYNVTELEIKPEEDDSNNLIARFIAAKRIEGCSEKTLKYYQTTIDALVVSIGKSVRHIHTEDLRIYLTEYQS